MPHGKQSDSSSQSNVPLKYTDAHACITTLGIYIQYSFPNKVSRGVGVLKQIFKKNPEAVLLKLVVIQGNIRTLFVAKMHRI